MGGMTSEPKNGWTPGLLLIHLTDAMKRTDEHFAADLGAMEKRFIDKLADADKRYEQRFLAQTEAVSAAANAAKEGVAAALAAAKEAVAAALNAADRGSAKAELASEKQVAAVREKLEGVGGVIKRMEELTSRIDTFIGRGGGQDELRIEGITQRNWGVQMFLLAIAAIGGFVMSVISFLRH